MGKLRLLLALSVVAGHCGALWNFHLLGGSDAVQVFYIISGFYMSLILNEKYVGENSSYKLFITNRFLRLAPLYWAVLLITICACSYALVSSGGINLTLFKSYKAGSPNFTSLIYIIAANIAIIGQDVALFLGISPDNGRLFFTTNFAASPLTVNSFFFIPQAWTLSLEFYFYLLAPFILKRGPKLIFSILIASLVLRLILYNFAGLKNDPWTYRFFPTELFFFLMGYLSYTLYKRVSAVIFTRWQGLAAFLVMLLFTLCYSYIPSQSVAFLPFTIKQIIYVILMVLLLPVLFKYFRNSKSDNKIGELSYPVYITHTTVCLVLNFRPFAALGLNSTFSVYLVTLILSYLLIKYIAEPVDRYRQARLNRLS